MAQVITFVGYKPIERYDSIPWTEARIEESDTAVFDEILVWSEVETVTLTPVDADPSDPVYRNFTTELASDTAGLWYRVVWVDATLDESSPTDAVQNVVDDVVMYATTDELARILKIRTPSADQESAMERCLIAASGEINSEIDLATDSTLSGWQLALANQVNLERAAELWKLQEVQFGVVLGTEFGPTHIARNTWDKHAYTLAPLKSQWGLAQMPTSVTTQDLLDEMANQIAAALIAATDMDIQVEPFHIAYPSPPTVDMYPGDIARGTEAAAFDVDGEFLFTVRVRVPGNDAETNLRLLNAFMDDVDELSVPLALYDDPTLGGLATSLDCVDPTGLVMYRYGGEELPGRQFTCKVIRADS